MNEINTDNNPAPANQIMAIRPYWDETTELWVFDDDRRGLTAEAFVGGMPTMIDTLIEQQGITNARKGFRLIFSAQPFPGYQEKLTHLGSSMFDDLEYGNWYACERLDLKGWLCPALLKYFVEAPNEIYVRAESISRGEGYPQAAS